MNNGLIFHIFTWDCNRFACKALDILACPSWSDGWVINPLKTRNDNDTEIESLIAQAESIKDNADAVLANVEEAEFALV